jgi:HTH-type transcriptional regulator / antitoxin HigA
MPKLSDLSQTAPGSLRTEEDYRAALAQAELVMNAAEGSPEADRLGTLVDAIEAYEAAHYPMEPPDPVGAILFRLDQMGLDEGYLAALIGAGEAEAVLARRKPLSLSVIRKLHNELGIPADILIQEYELAQTA